MAKSRNTRIGVFTFAIAVAVFLLCGLFPGFASASQLEAGQADAQTLSTQEKTKTVYVITSTNTTADWGIVSIVDDKITYNKDGLVKKIVSSSNMDGNWTTTYSYKGTNLKSAKATQPDYSVVGTYTTNKKGQMTKAVKVSKYPPEVKDTSTYVGTYKSGKLKKVVCNRVVEQQGNEVASSSNTVSFTYKNGRMASSKQGSTTTTYGYDSKGNLNKSNEKEYKTTYKKNRLTKRTYSGEDYTVKETYKYKAIKVKASVADKVEAQQWAILNDNLNFAFGIDEDF